MANALAESRLLDQEARFSVKATDCGEVGETVMKRFFRAVEECHIWALFVVCQVVSILLMILFGITLCSCSGCSGDKDEPELAKEVPKTFSIAISEEPDSLIPILGTSCAARQIVGLVFDGLTNPKGLNDDLRPNFQLALAEGIYEVDPDERWKLRIELKRGILWHNGKPFNAQDVMYTW